MNLTSTNFAFKWAFQPFARAMLVSCFLEVPRDANSHQLFCPIMSSCAQSGKNIKWYIVFDNLIIAYQAPSDVWRHPCISGYGGQRLPNVTQRDLPLPQARFHSALVPDCATSLKKSPVNCDPGCPTSELCSAPEPLVTPVCF